MPRRRTFHRQPRRSDNQGFGSGLEKTNNQILVKAGCTFHYEDEACQFHYKKPTYKGECGTCGGHDVYSNHLYTADFKVITKSGKEIWIEIKGGGVSWTGETRSKHVLIRDQFPDRELRFVFSNWNASIGKNAKTTNKQWCASKGFLCANQKIPLSWLEE